MMAGSIKKLYLQIIRERCIWVRNYVQESKLQGSSNPTFRDEGFILLPLAFCSSFLPKKYCRIVHDVD